MSPQRLATVSTVLLIATLAPAAPAQVYDLSWATIDCGGGASGGGSYELAGTIGQPDAGVMTGGAFSLTGGFWGRASADCPGDVTGDGVVDLSDLATLLVNYGTSAGATRGDGDLNGDGAVDLSDLSELLARFGNIC